MATLSVTPYLNLRLGHARSPARTHDALDGVHGQPAFSGILVSPLIFSGLVLRSCQPSMAAALI
jgi:hypothetical protein